MDIYSLSRNFWDYAFENPESVRPIHASLYFFSIEHCNRLGWKEKFGLPTSMAKEAIGVHSYNTYIKALNDLVSFGFINLVEKSKNQYSSNIICFTRAASKNCKALDKALTKHGTKQSESTVQSIDSIDIQLYQYTNLQRESIEKILTHLNSLDENTRSEKIKQLLLVEPFKKTIETDPLKITKNSFAEREAFLSYLTRESIFVHLIQSLGIRPERSNYLKRFLTEKTTQWDLDGSLENHTVGKLMSWFPKDWKAFEKANVPQYKFQS